MQNSTNGTELKCHLEITNYFGFNVAVSLCYVPLILLGVGGNILVLNTIRRKSFTSVTHLFLWNLSLNDIMALLTIIPNNMILDIWIKDYPFSGNICLLSNFIQSLTVYTAILTHVIIAMDRYANIYWPFKWRGFITRRRGKTLIVCIWVVSGVNAILIALNWTVVNGQCREMHETMSFFLDYFQFSLQYLIPTGFTTFFYFSIILRVIGRSIPGVIDISREQRIAASRKKMIKMLITIWLFYSLTQLPRHIVYYVGSNLHWCAHFLRESWIISVLISACPAVHNPIVYAWMNPRYRSSMIRDITYRSCCGPMDKKMRNGDKKLQDEDKMTIQCKKLSSSK